VISRFAPHLVLPVGPRDHIRGAHNAPVTLVEYGDYECPFCGQAHLITTELVRQMDGQLRFVFRNFPLTTMHPHAELAAEAAEAAGAQRKFWEMHDTLYENQQALEPEDLLHYAAALGLDLTRFSDELATHAHYDRIHEDFMGGVQSGVQGTPTFFINGIRHDGSWDLETLGSAILAARRSAPRTRKAS
jgi:protein-disulfide isomerase